MTRGIAPNRLHCFSSRYVDALWPVARMVRRLPRIGSALKSRLLIPDYSVHIEDDEILRDWVRLDTSDMLVPRYDNPSRESTARRWCQELRLISIDVQPGYNG